MKDRNNGEEAKQDQGLMTRLLQELKSEEYQKLQEQTRKGMHPTSDILYDYVTGDIDEQDAEIVRRHLLFCEICTDEMARLIRIDRYVEEELEQWAEQAAPDSPPEKVEIPPFMPLLPLFPNLPGVIATEFWQPRLEETAAATREKEHIFAVGDGEITLLCYWQGEYRDKPPFIRISWKANISVRSEIWVQFATQEAQPEFCLGTDVSGEETFTHQDLGFDPSTEPWGVALGLRERETLLEEIATEYWEPKWVGKQVSAADIPEQRHTFRMAEGNLELSCSWRGKTAGSSAYIRLKWDARLTSRKEIWVRFSDPETQSLRCEKLLGTLWKGEKPFYQDDLGFDPSRDPWAIAIILRERDTSDESGEV